MAANLDNKTKSKSAEHGAATGLMDLPDEILELMLQYVPFRALKHLSSVSKRLDRLVKPELFRSLDLGSHKAAELERLYEELCVDTNGTLGPLARMHVGSLAYRLIEETIDEPETAEALLVFDKIADSIGGVAVFSIEMSLITEDINCFEEHLIPTLNGIVNKMSNRITSYKMRVDAYGSSPSLPAAQEIIANKLDKVLSLFPSDSISSLHVEGLSMTYLSPNLYRTLASGTLKDLAFKNCADFFGVVPPTIGLRRLSMSWFGCDEVASAGLATGNRLLSVNSSTITSLVLQNLTGQNVHISNLAGEPLVLSALTYLEVTDTSMNEGSVLDHLLENTKMPNLRVLDLDIEDIIDFNKNTSKMLEHSPALEQINLRESRISPMPQDAYDASAYQGLQLTCELRGIKLNSTHSSLRCDGPEELANEAKRMSILADTLTEVHLTCQPEALAAVATLDNFTAPSVDRIWLSVGDIMSSMAKGEDEGSATTHSIYEFCKWLHAPTCRELQVILFINEESADAMFSTLQQVLKDRLYPNLEVISGTLMSMPAMSSEMVNKWESSIREVCDDLSIDCKDLKFVGRKTLTPSRLPALADSQYLYESTGCEQQQEHGGGLEDSGYESYDINRLLAALDIDDGDQQPVVTGNHIRWD